MPRNTLANVLAGHAIDWSDVADAQADALLGTAQAEGVVALVQLALAGMETVPRALLDDFSAAARAGAAAAMARQAECRRICDLLAAANLQPLVLKGLALGAWLYPQQYLRESSDIDLLFASRTDADRAAALLEPRGYAVLFRPDDFAHEFLCRGGMGSVQIDLDMHWRISAMPLFRSVFSFSELQAASIPLPSLGPEARGLGSVHACLHACIHRASNLCSGIGDRLKWLYDLHLLALHFSDEDWASLVRLCRERALCGVCAEGLEAAASTFDTPLPGEIRQALTTGRAREAFDASRLDDWGYVQRQNFKALPSLTLRARWLWQRLFPAAGYMRELYGPAQGRMALLMERGKRALRRLAS